MGKFFIPEDFQYDAHVFEGNLYIKIAYAANRANEKLAREGKVVYSSEKEHEYETWLKGTVNPNLKYQALLIDIKPITKCEHPKEKINKIYNHAKGFFPSHISFECECGAKVEPSGFKEAYK